MSGEGVSAGPSDGGAASTGVEVATPMRCMRLAPTDVKGLSKARKLELLREARTRPFRQPSLILLCCTDVMASGGLGDEVYEVTEQCLIAALECGQQAHADACLQALASKFGVKSMRVRKLVGLVAEAKGDIRGANKIYQEIMAKDSKDDLFCVKRMVAMNKSIGGYQDAIDILTQKNVYVDDDGNALKLLDVHVANEWVFRELVNLNVLVNNIPRALHYAEEVLLLQPYDYLDHTRHAELCYTLRQLDQSATSYAQSLRLNAGRNNTRAAYGLWLVSSELCKTRAKDSGSSEEKRAALENAKALQAWATAKLKACYVGSPLAAVLDLTLSRVA